MASRVLSCAATMVTPPKLNGMPESSMTCYPSLLLLSSSSPSKAAAKVTLRIGSVKCKALGEASQNSFDRTVYQGIYGPWTVDSSDVREVPTRLYLIHSFPFFHLLARDAPFN